jgi:predicted RNA-binding protein Jag
LTDRAEAGGSGAQPSLDTPLGRIESLLRDIIRYGQFQLSFTIRQNPPSTTQHSTEDPESPEIVVDFSGPDSGLLLEAHAELLNALEYVALRALRIEERHFPKISFDCQGWRRERVEELKLMAHVAADRVRETGAPFELAPMNARERRIIHLALGGRPEVRTSSDGQGPGRRVVVMPASAPAAGR